MKAVIYYGIVCLLSGAAGYFVGLFVASFKEQKLNQKIRFLRSELILKKEQLGEFEEVQSP